MRICYLAEAENIHTKRWARAIAARGHEVKVITDFATVHAKQETAYEVLAPDWSLHEKLLAFRLYPRPYGNNRWKYLPYRRALGKYRPDIIHGMELLHNGYAAARLFGDSGPPRVMTPWGGDIERDPLQSPKARFLVEYALHHCEFITTNRPGLDEFLHRQFGVPREKTAGLSWGVDLRIFHQDYAAQAHAMREKLQIPPRAQVILSPRTFDEYWEVEKIIESVPLIVKKHPNVFFIFLLGAGNLEYAERQFRFLKWKQVQHHTALVREMLAPEQMAALYNLADMFMSVPKTDFLAQTILEAMACGCVPVCRRLPAYAERVRHGETGLYIEEPVGAETIAQAAEIVLDNTTLRAEMAKASAAQGRALDDEQPGLARMEHIYQSLHEGKKPVF